MSFSRSRVSFRAWVCECLVWLSGFYKNFVKTFFYSLGIFFISVSVYRAAAGVEEPVCIFPVDKIALWKLLAACHLENNDNDNEDHDYADDNINDYDDQDQDLVRTPGDGDGDDNIVDQDQDGERR